MPQRFSGLGRGLGSLIPQKRSSATVETAKPEALVPSASGDSSVTAGLPTEALAKAGRVLQVPVSAVVANPDQPRSAFGHQELEDLMNSVREHGIIQPLLVSTRPDGGYELIAGERRLRAAKMLGLPTVPVVVREARNDGKLLLALVENIQRQDLNPVEEARAYERLISEFGLTQEAVAKKVGKARPTVANALRLLELPPEIVEAVASGAVSAGAARAILSLKDDRSRMSFFRRLTKERMSARQAEAAARRNGSPARREAAAAAAEEELREALGARVEIKKRGGRGAIVISFYSEEEYDGLLRKLRR